MSWSIAPRSMDVGAPRGPGSDVGRALVPPDRAGLGTRSCFDPLAAPGVLRAEQPKIVAASPRSDRVDPELKSHPALPRYIFFFLSLFIYKAFQPHLNLLSFHFFLCVCFSSFLPLINHSSGPARPINYSSHLDLSEMQLQMQFNLLTHDR